MDHLSLRRGELHERVGRLEQVAGVRLVTLADGPERGVRVLEFRAAPLEFDVLVDRAFDIGRCEAAGRPLAWLSGAGTPGPWYGEPGGLGFFRTFPGGLLTTCGLDHALGTADDDARTYGYPPRATEHYGLHGRASTLPARLLGYGERWEGDTLVLWAEGEVRQVAVFGEHLRLVRRIETRVGSGEITVQDRVTNVGFARTPHMLLYHVNVGWPVVDAGARILVPATEVRPRGAHAVEGYDELHAPAAGFVEEVFEHGLRVEDGGTVPVGIVNREAGLGVFQVFRADQLPHHLTWRMLGQGHYVVGLEPSTNRAAGRLDARERDELIELEAGEERRYELRLGALIGQAALDGFARRVADVGRAGAHV